MKAGFATLRAAKIPTWVDAAALTGKSRTDFILESAIRDAQQVLLDQCFFQLDEFAFDRMVEILDNPPAPSAALRRLLATPAPWE